MRLADLVHQETDVDYEQIMLLRHRNADVDALREIGGSMEEHTRIQPKNSRYDFWKEGMPKIGVVVVVARDHVAGVYRIVRLEREGTYAQLSSQRYWQFRTEFRADSKRDGDARCFELARVPSAADGQPVTSWEGSWICATLRSGDKRFSNIAIELPEQPPIYVEMQDFTEKEMEQALGDGRLRFGNVETSESKAVTRQRRGQEVLRRRTLRSHGRRCAICEISDERLLRASHIVG